MKKKFLVILLAFVMVFSAVACGNNDDVINDGRETTAKEDINDAADSVKNGVEDTGDAVKDTGDAVKDGIDDMKNDVDNTKDIDKDKTNE